MAPWYKDRKNGVIAGLTVLVCVLVWRMGHGTHEVTAPPVAATEEVWTCSMHPQVRLPKPGLCPICGMDLIRAEDDLEGDWTLVLSPQARKLAEIETVAVRRGAVPHAVRMVGKVAYDEKRVSDITARVPGRIDRLFVDFTGIEVHRGDHMVSLYSPDLVTAQQELHQARQSLDHGPAALRSASEARWKAARKKMELLGLSDTQIEAIETRENPSDNLVIEAPMSGRVIKKHVNEGAYVKTGSPIYTLADLSRVWVMLDAYESELAWLRYGQEVTLEVEAYPGETWKGRIVFIDPALDPVTRTVKLRIDLPNPGERLKPDMFVRAQAHALISEDGRVMDPSLAGKWISRMHPEIVKDGPGTCDVCGMALERAEDLGFVTAEGRDAPLIIPASAALVTGERAVVYVADPEDAGRYTGREVVLGPEVGDAYVVTEGLREGERVVVNGAFKIDSELQIRAKKSMMYHADAVPADVSAADAVQDMPDREAATPAAGGDAGAGLPATLMDAYFSMQGHLSDDALHPAHAAARALKEAMEAVDASTFSPAGRAVWTREAPKLTEALVRFGEARDLDAAREAFEPLSTVMTTLVRGVGGPADGAVYRFHCPMALGGAGADWLQDHVTTRNPYYGASMLGCGDRVETLTSAAAAHGGHTHD